MPARLPEISSRLFVAMRDELGLTNHAIARLCGYASSTAVDRWARGERPIPPRVRRWLAKLHAFHHRNPPPFMGLRRKEKRPGHEAQGAESLSDNSPEDRPGHQPAQ